MADITLQWDSQDLKIFRTRAVDKALLRALSKAGGEAVRAMKAASSRSIRGRKRFKVRTINNALALVYPRGSKSIGSLVWRMNVSGKPAPLADFPHTQTAKGVSVAVNNGKRKVLKHAFIATMKTGHKGVFFRTGDKRLPIKEAFTTRVSDVFKDNGMVPAVYAQTDKVFSTAFARLLPLELEKL